MLISVICTRLTHIKYRNSVFEKGEQVKERRDCLGKSLYRFLRPSLSYTEIKCANEIFMQRKLQSTHWKVGLRGLTIQSDYNFFLLQKSNSAMLKSKSVSNRKRREIPIVECIPVFYIDIVFRREIVVESGAQIKTKFCITITYSFIRIPGIDHGNTR